MGYTHYWYVPESIPLDVFKKIVSDFKKIIPDMEKMGVRLAGGSGRGKPKISYDEVLFNGKSRCGHPENLRVLIPWPTKDAKGIAKDSNFAIAGNWFAGTLLNSRTCDGDCSYESFHFPRTYVKQEINKWMEIDDSQNPKENGKIFSFCKTAYRPYDFAVICFLTIAKHYLGEDIIVKTDGDNTQWDCFDFLQERLGYGKEYHITREGELQLS